MTGEIVSISYLSSFTDFVMALVIPEYNLSNFSGSMASESEYCEKSEFTTLLSSSNLITISLAVLVMISLSLIWKAPFSPLSLSNLSFTNIISNYQMERTV